MSDVRQKPLTAAQGDRRKAILDAAKLVFFEDGYQVASMDRVADAAGTTKRTVYSYFPSKAALFGAAVEQGCAHVVAQLPGPDDLADDPEVGLRDAMTRSSVLMGSANCVSMQRIIAAEAERHPQFAASLARAFAAGEAKMAAYLDRCIASGRLKTHDTALTARLLGDVVAQATAMRGLIGAGPVGQSQAVIEETARLLLAAYRA